MRIKDIISENWANNAHLGAGSERAQDQRLLEKQTKKIKRQSKLKEGIPIPPALVQALMRKFPQFAAYPAKIQAMAAEIIKKSVRYRINWEICEENAKDKPSVQRICSTPSAREGC